MILGPIQRTPHADFYLGTGSVKVEFEAVLHWAVSAVLLQSELEFAFAGVSGNTLAEEHP